MTKVGMISGNQQHAFADRGDDLYETPDVAVHALLKAEDIPLSVWEPACGPGAIVKVLRANNRMVYATNLIDHGCPDSESGVDFLMETQAPGFYIGAIVTNPPYKLAAEFATHALTLGIPKVVMLMRLAFLESERRSALLDGGLLARVYVFRNRLPMMHRHGWQGPRVRSGAVAFAWFVWDLTHRGPTELHRISWE